MLRNAPKFFEVAKRIVEITEDCIIVAHNADFDYRILRTEFKRLGFNFKRNTLCTVELAQELIPNQDSYSLGKLTRSLGIPVTERHRANGDAMATVRLFKILLAKDSDKKIVKHNIKEHKAEKINANHVDIVESLPAVTGVYYMHDKNGAIFYIGKSRNIKHKVNQHLTNSNRKSKKMQDMVKSVSYETTGSELVALLKENEEIKRIKPKLNQSLRYKKYSHGLYCFTDSNGRKNLKIKHLSKIDGLPITTFSNFHSASSFLGKIAVTHELCPALMGLDPNNFKCANHDGAKCDGSCVDVEHLQDYNERVTNLIFEISYNNQNLAIVDKGRNVNERSVIYIKNGLFQGIGFTELNHQINNREILESIITPMKSNKDTQHIIQSYLRKNKRLKLIPIQFN